MKVLIDNANIDNIKDIYKYYPIDGVTTNPSILSKNGRAPYEVLTEIRQFIGNDAELHVQVISTKAEDMVEEGRKIVEVLGRNTYIKIPTIPEGLKAMQILSKEGYNVTATAIYTAMQGFLAAKAGAKYVAPYVNRIDNLGADGIATAREIHNILKANNLNTEVLAASFTNSQQVQSLCLSGLGAATLAPNVLHNLIRNASVDDAEDTFLSDFESLCGQGKTMLNCGE